MSAGQAVCLSAKHVCPCSVSKPLTDDVPSSRLSAKAKMKKLRNDVGMMMTMMAV
jgi:hypothetical protein